MTTREFKLPDPGEGLLEAEIVEWKVAVGDAVKVNDIVVEVETAKSLVELPIPWAGTVTGIHVAVGDEVEVGTVIITIDDGAEGAAPADSTPAAESPAPDTAADGADEEPVKTLVGYGPKASGTTRRARRTPAAPTANAAPAAPTPVGGAEAEAGEAPRPSAAETRALAKPPVRKLAKDLGIDLGAVPPTGERGIVTRADVESYAAGRANPSAASVVAPPTEACDMPPQEAQLQIARAGYGGARRTSGWAAGDDREVRTPIKGVRKVTAQAMVGSAFTAPHVTEWVQVDVTATMELVARLKADREFKDVKVTPLTILAKAICLAVRRNPGVNATWDEAAQEIVEKHYVNLGIAAATPAGSSCPTSRTPTR